MASIVAENVVVDYPVYGTAHRSLKTSVLRAATGGAFASDGGDGIVVRALDGITFSFKEGDRVGLLGHNGSGKSTLLRVVAGAYEPVRGRMEVRGDIVSMLSIQLGIDYEASGYENTFLLGAVMGQSRQRMRERVDDIRGFSELGEFFYLPVRTYSSGMVMRLAFAVATSMPADIVLMDEWLSVGDQGFAQKAQARLAALLDSAKILLLASHSEELIRRNCNWVLRLEHGKMVSLDAIAARGG
jgi:lipopolysaccharide transport system ATP-binding protein